MHFEMKQMVYTADRKREVLDMGEYKGFTYAIISLGWHPCAYVKIPENHKYFNVDYNDLPMIDCHGGITYSESYLAVADDKDLDGWWIGWDYSHYMDFSGRFLRPNNFIMEGKKYSTAEILSDVFKVIEQLESDKYYVGDLEEICGDTFPTYCPHCDARMDEKDGEK